MQQPVENYGQGPIIGGPDPSRPAPAVHQQRNQTAEMSPEEKRVFQECNSESYYKRSLPVTMPFSVPSVCYDYVL